MNPTDALTILENIQRVHARLETQTADALDVASIAEVTAARDAIPPGFDPINREVVSALHALRVDLHRLTGTLDDLGKLTRRNIAAIDR